jgi:hypothetical protein
MEMLTWKTAMEETEEEVMEEEVMEEMEEEEVMDNNSNLEEVLVKCFKM